MNDTSHGDSLRINGNLVFGFNGFTEDGSEDQRLDRIKTKKKFRSS